MSKNSGQCEPRRSGINVCKLLPTGDRDASTVTLTVNVNFHSVHIFSGIVKSAKIYTFTV